MEQRANGSSSGNGGGSGPEHRRPENRRLRELVDEMLVTVRIAAGRDLWTAEDRLTATTQLDEMLGDTMRRLRREVMEPGGGGAPVARPSWRAPTPVFTRDAMAGPARERRVRGRMRLRRELEALLDAIRIASHPETGRRGRWETADERAMYERQLERIMSAVRTEAMGRGIES